MSVRSSLGGQLGRAANLSIDSSGKRIPPIPPGFDGIRCKETPPHALSSPDAEQSWEARAERDGRAANELARLTDLEREVLKLQGKLKHRIEERRTIAAGELSSWLRDGYTLIPGSETTVEREGQPSISCVDVVGSDVIEAGKLNYEDIAERLGITYRQVNSLVSSANRKLRAAHRR